MRPRAIAVIGCLLLLLGCSDDSEGGTATSSSSPPTSAAIGDSVEPDAVALAAWLSETSSPIDVAEVKEIYADYECDEANSSFVLVRALSEPIEGVDPEVALHTQVAVDTYLCGPAYARSVIELTFQPGEANTELNALIDDLGERP